MYKLIGNHKSKNGKNMQRIKRKEYKYITKESQQTMRRDQKNKGSEKKYETTSKK